MFGNKIVGLQTAVVCCFLLLYRPHRNQLLLLRLGRLQFRLMAAQSRLQLRILRRPCLILVLRQYLRRLHIRIGESQRPCLRHIDMRHGTAFQRRQYRLITQFGQLGSLQSLLRLHHIAIRAHGFQFRQRFTPLHMLPVAYMHCLNHRRFQRLNGFAAPARHRLARSRRHNIDFAEPGPQQSQKRKRHNKTRRPFRSGRDRRIGQFQMRGQKRQFFRRAFGRFQLVAHRPNIAPYGNVAGKKGF